MTIKARNSVAFFVDGNEEIKLDAPPTPKNLPGIVTKTTQGPQSTHFLRRPVPTLRTELEPVFDDVGSRAEGRATSDLEVFKQRLAAINLWQWGQDTPKETLEAQGEVLQAFQDKAFMASVQQHLNVVELLEKAKSLLQDSTTFRIPEDALEEAAALLTSFLVAIDMDMTDDGTKICGSSQDLQHKFMLIRRAAHQTLSHADNRIPLSAFHGLAHTLKSTSPAGSNPEEVILHVLSEKMRGDPSYLTHFLLEKFAFVKPGAIDNYEKLIVSYPGKLDMGEMLYSHIFGEDHPGWKSGLFRNNLGACAYSAKELASSGVSLIAERKGIKFTFVNSQQRFLRSDVQELHVPFTDLTGLRKNAFFSIANDLDVFEHDAITSSYYTLMGMLVTCGEDVVVLRRSGVLVHDFESNETCADFISRVARARPVQRHLSEHLADGIEKMMEVVLADKYQDSVAAKRQRQSSGFLWPAAVALLAIIVLLIVNVVFISQELKAVKSLNSGSFSSFPSGS